MRVITANPVLDEVEFSYAFGDGIKSAWGNWRAGAEDRRTARRGRRDTRRTNRLTERTNRNAQISQDLVRQQRELDGYSPMQKMPIPTTQDAIDALQRTGTANVLPTVDVTANPNARTNVNLQTPPTRRGLSRNAIIGIAVGGAVVLGLGIYLATRKK